MQCVVTCRGQGCHVARVPGYQGAMLGVSGILGFWVPGFLGSWVLGVFGAWVAWVGAWVLGCLVLVSVDLHVLTPSANKV